MSNRQEQLDKLKDKISGNKIVKWEDIKRETSGQSVYDLSWLDKTKGTNLAKLEGDNKLAIKENFIKDLEKQIVQGRNINEYRELKTFLVEQSEYISKQTTLDNSELQKYIDKLNDLIFETNTERYEEAVKLLSDEETFKELEKASQEYHKTVQALAIETVIQKQNKLSSAKVNLLEILREGREDE